MARSEVFSNSECPTLEIAAYLDGELAPERETVLEKHLAMCVQCSEELRLQKQFLCSLDSSMSGEFDIELPANFTKRLVTNAESSVSGLRRPGELFSTLFVCAALLIFVLFALGPDANSLIAQVIAFGEKIATIGNFVGHITYSLLVGFGVVLRTVSGQFQIPAVLMILAGAVVVLSYLVSRSRSRLRRT
ncbi:MAG: zf-HC2 domain-containing protein [Pyrinomonadaceae bacterium]|nr:zf-HC2 domain-containing protein [Pyrinomonadaceae bacterium]